MDGSEEGSNWGRSSNRPRGFNLNAPSYFPTSSPSFALPSRANTPPPTTSSSTQVLEVERERLHLWDGGGGRAALPRRGGAKTSEGEGDLSLREWLDNPSRTVELVECLHIFRQIVDMVSVAHAQGVVVKNVRPSCLVLALSVLNRVSLVELTSCSTTLGSGLGSASAADSSEEEQKKGCSLRSCFAPEEDSSWGGEGERMMRDISERKRVFPLKRILMMESNWYLSPEEAAGGESSFASDVYRLGVLLFELFCTSSSPEEKLRTMSNLRHRVLPPQLLLKWPKEASFCLWLLHPIPSTRPKISEVLKSEFLAGPKDNLEEHATTIKLQEEIEDEDLLLEFLTHLKERKQETANRLHDVICCLSSDIEEVMKKQSNLREKVGPLQEFDNDDHSGFERVDLPSVYPERIKDSVSYGPRKRPRPWQQSCSGSEADEHVPGGLGSDVRSTLKESILSKSSRLMKNFKKLESAYFMMRCRTMKPVGKFQNRNLPSGSLGKGSVVRTEGSSVGNFMPRESTSLGRKGEWINPFLEGLCKYLAFSKLTARADLKQGDLLSSSNLVCSLAFDRDKDLFATAGVNRKIKVFECDAILGEDRDIHYPVVEMSGRSKFSSICWNSYIKSQIASSDFEGIVQVWDATRSEAIVQMQEHEKRVWCVDFSLANPTKLASGSDDGTVKLWSINQLGSIGTIKTKANVCSVQFRPDSGHFVAIGSADHKVCCYDLRNLRIPWCTLIGHSKTVSYIKFVDSTTLVSASTDNTIKLWDLSSGATVLGDPLQTFTGHTNIKNFVGLSISDGYIATGSETNEVFVYHKAFPMPMLSLGFDSTDPILGRGVDDTAQFVSCVCWRGQSNTLVATNSSGNIKLLEMV